MSLHLDPGVHQEPSNIHTKAVVWVCVAFVIVTIIGIVVADALIYEAQLPLPTPGPLIQNIHTGPIARQRRGMLQIGEAEQRLRQLGWIDRAAGIAHVPIEDAKRIWLAGQARTEAP